MAISYFRKVVADEPVAEATRAPGGKGGQRIPGFGALELSCR